MDGKRNGWWWEGFDQRWWWGGGSPGRALTPREGPGGVSGGPSAGVAHDVRIPGKVIERGPRNHYVKSSIPCLKKGAGYVTAGPWWGSRARRPRKWGVISGYTGRRLPGAYWGGEVKVTYPHGLVEFVRYCWTCSRDSHIAFPDSFQERALSLVMLWFSGNHFECRNALGLWPDVPVVKKGGKAVNGGFPEEDVQKPWAVGVFVFPLFAWE